MEIEIIQAIQLIRNDFLDILFQGITMLGEQGLMVVLFSILYWLYDKRLGEYLAFSLFTSVWLNGVVKDFVKTSRPIGVEGIYSLRIETATGYSFPSGHTQSGTTVYLSLARWSKKPLWMVGAVLLSLLIGVSRLYLGVHWPSDVLAGLVLGAAVSLASYWVFTHVHNLTIVYYLLSLAALVSLFWAKSADTIKAAALLCGFAAGIHLEKRFVHFTTKLPFLKKLLRWVVGLVLLGILYGGLKLLFPPLLPFTFVRYFLVSFVGIGVYPYLFTRLRF